MDIFSLAWVVDEKYYKLKKLAQRHRLVSQMRVPSVRILLATTRHPYRSNRRRHGRFFDKSPRREHREQRLPQNRTSKRATNITLQVFSSTDRPLAAPCAKTNLARTSRQIGLCRIHYVTWCLGQGTKSRRCCTQVVTWCLDLF